MIVLIFMKIVKYEFTKIQNFIKLIQGLASYDEMCDVYLMYWADPGDDENQVRM